MDHYLTRLQAQRAQVSQRVMQNQASPSNTNALGRFITGIVQAGTSAVQSLLDRVRTVARERELNRKHTRAASELKRLDAEIARLSESQRQHTLADLRPNDDRPLRMSRPTVTPRPIPDIAPPLVSEQLARRQRQAQVQQAREILLNAGKGILNWGSNLLQNPVETVRAFGQGVQLNRDYGVDLTADYGAETWLEWTPDQVNDVYASTKTTAQGIHDTLDASLGASAVNFITTPNQTFRDTVGAVEIRLSNNVSQTKAIFDPDSDTSLIEINDTSSIHDDGMTWDVVRQYGRLLDKRSFAYAEQEMEMYGVPGANGELISGAVKDQNVWNSLVSSVMSNLPNWQSNGEGLLDLSHYGGPNSSSGELNSAQDEFAEMFAQWVFFKDVMSQDDLSPEGGQYDYSRFLTYLIENADNDVYIPPLYNTQFRNQGQVINGIFYPLGFDQTITDLKSLAAEIIGDQVYAMPDNQPGILMEALLSHLRYLGQQGHFGDATLPDIEYGVEKIIRTDGNFIPNELWIYLDLYFQLHDKQHKQLSTVFSRMQQTEGLVAGSATNALIWRNDTFQDNVITTVAIADQQMHESALYKNDLTGNEININWDNLTDSGSTSSAVHNPAVFAAYQRYQTLKEKPLNDLSPTDIHELANLQRQLLLFQLVSQNEARSLGLLPRDISFSDFAFPFVSPALHDVSTIELIEFLTDNYNGELSPELSKILQALQLDSTNPDFRDVYNNPIPSAPIATIERNGAIDALLLALNFVPGVGTVIDAIDFIDSLARGDGFSAAIILFSFGMVNGQTVKAFRHSDDLADFLHGLGVSGETIEQIVDAANRGRMDEFADLIVRARLVGETSLETVQAHYRVIDLLERQGIDISNVDNPQLDIFVTMLTRGEKGEDRLVQFVNQIDNDELIRIFATNPSLVNQIDVTVPELAQYNATYGMSRNTTANAIPFKYTVTGKPDPNVAIFLPNADGDLIEFDWYRIDGDETVLLDAKNILKLDNLTGIRQWEMDIQTGAREEATRQIEAALQNGITRIEWIVPSNEAREAMQDILDVVSQNSMISIKLPGES